MYTALFYNTWEFLIITLEMILFYIFVAGKLSPKKLSTTTYTAQFIFLSVQAILTYLCNRNSLSTLITILLSLILNVVFVLIFFQGTFIFRFFCGTIFSVICLFAEYLTILIPQLFSNLNIQEILAGGTLRVPFSALYITLIAVFVFLSVNIFSNNIHLSAIQKIIYITLSILGIGISHYILIITLTFAHSPLATTLTDKLILINLCFLMMFLALLIYIYQLGQSNEQNMSFLEKEKQHELEEQQYRILLETTDSLRKMKHDAKIHLDVIQTLSEQNKLSELQDYIRAYHTTLDNTHHLLSTGNTAIDCVLSNKLSYAKQCEIKMEYSVIAPSPFPLDAITLSSLLGNILDNAIEACLRNNSSETSCEPWIRFYIKPFQNMILIHSENNFDGILKRNARHEFLSRKKEKEHGLGIKRITDIVNEVNGIIQITTAQNIFTIHIMIPLKETPNDET